MILSEEVFDKLVLPFLMAGEEGDKGRKRGYSRRKGRNKEKKAMENEEKGNHLVTTSCQWRWDIEKNELKINCCD